jgi:hypothetical protein
MGTYYQTQQSTNVTAVMRQLMKKSARVMKRVRVDRAMVTAKETRVTVTRVAAMMANGAKDSAWPHNN